MHDAFIGQVRQGLLQAAERRRLATERHSNQHHTVAHDVTLVEPWSRHKKALSSHYDMTSPGVLDDASRDIGKTKQ